MSKRRFAAKITTIFGISFRSRLEAHVACTLTAIGISWKYEPRHFKIGKRLFYLPDFLCQYRGEYWYLEVKPKKPYNIEVTKAKGLVRVGKLPVMVTTSCPFFGKQFSAVMYWKEGDRAEQSQGLVGDFLGIRYSEMELFIAQARELYRREMAA